MPDLNEQLRAELIALALECGAANMVSCMTHPKGPTTAVKFDVDSDSIVKFAEALAARRQHGSAAQAVAHSPSECKVWFCPNCSFAAPPSADATLDKAAIREIFMSHGFTVKEGQSDLKQYVYDAADVLIRAALSRRPAAAAEPELLPLPQAHSFTVRGIPRHVFTADQMQDYARAHLRAAGQGSKDSERLDWLEANCTGASNSDRYLPFRVYWGNKGATKGIRVQLDKAMKAGAQGGGK